MGAKLAGELLADYERKHREGADKLAFTLWAVETIRHEGVVESQILNPLGARPHWDRGGRVTGVEPIPRKELGHPRVDVVVTPSGLYRDVFPNLMTWIDEAVSLARDQDELDNLVRAHILVAAKALRAKGVPADKAQRMASVRLFTPPSGVYGAGMGSVPDSQSWENESQVAAGYFRHMGFLYGQGFWGESPREQATGKADLGQELFKQALSGTKLAVHSMTSNVVATIDNDDFYEYLGGTALAVRTLDGKSPELYVTDMSQPKQARQTPLARVVGQEMRTRYLNPKWIERMMGEGYAGARYISEVVENLWGWQVTAPEVVGGEKWQELYETYVADKHGLHVKESFRKSGNPWAHQVVMARMLEAVRKNYWKPDRKVVESIARAYAENADEHGMACASQTCDNPALAALTASTLTSIPGLEPLAQKFTAAVRSVRTPAAGRQAAPAKPAQGEQSAPKPAAVKSAAAKPAAKPVEGFQMEEVKGGGRPSAPIPCWFLGGFLLFVVLLALGWRRGSPR
jgi:cobaltochelatase CobN